MKYLIIVLSISVLFSAPAQYQVYRTDNPPVIDGNLSDWDDVYFIDSLHSDTNVLVRDSENPWTSSDYNGRLYMCWDSNLVYFAVKVTQDDSYIRGDPPYGEYAIDNLKGDPGGQSMNFYIGSNENIFTSASCPYILGSNLFADVNPIGNNGLPTYEFAISRKALMPWTEFSMFQFMVGTCDNDSAIDNDQTIIGFGVEYTGDKNDRMGSPWENGGYYPTYTIMDSNPMASMKEAHVFWYKANTNNYPITNCIDDKGPCLPDNAVIHEGITASGSINQGTSNQTADLIKIGSGIADFEGNCAFFWSHDLTNFTGNVQKAVFRIEEADGYCGQSFRNEGPINIRLGVADFIDNFGEWEPSSIPETMYWMDFNNPLSSSMGYNFLTTALAAEENLSYTAPASRPDEFASSVLDSQFIEIDITEQVNWILQNDGHYAVCFLSSPNEGNTGKIVGYSAEDGTGRNTACMQSDNPWTQDGNTAHIVVYGDLEPVSIKNHPEIAPESPVIGQNYPNPFNPTTRIPYNLNQDRVGELKIFDISGKYINSYNIKGNGSIYWNAERFASGVYIIKLRTENETDSRKIILQR